jgi:hypothetical protein
MWISPGTVLSLGCGERKGEACQTPVPVGLRAFVRAFITFTLTRPPVESFPPFLPPMKVTKFGAAALTVLVAEFARANDEMYDCRPPDWEIDHSSKLVCVLRQCHRLRCCTGLSSFLVLQLGYLSRYTFDHAEASEAFIQIAEVRTVV